MKQVKDVTWTWRLSQAANAKAIGLAHNGYSLDSIIDVIRKTRWLPERCLYPCAIRAIEIVKQK